MSALVERLGWMLVHSIWEDTIIWILLQTVLSILQKRSAQARYLVACLALALMALLPWMTFSSMDLCARLRGAPATHASTTAQWHDASSLTSMADSLGFALSSSPTESSGIFSASAPQKTFVDAILPWVVCGWILGVAVFSFRLWVSWLSIRTLARKPLPPLSAALQQRFRKLCLTAGVRSVVRLGESTAVAVPLVVGWLKPIILLPLGVLVQLPPEQVEAILLHELAHIRRHDFVVNLLQSVVETLFFYHPAVRSINRRIREERELICDDLVVKWCRNPIACAEALTTFEEFRRRSLALGITGEGDLLTRVRRIVLGVEPRQRTANLFAVAGLLATGAYLASMFLTPLLAANLMTDQERIDSLTASQTQQNGPSETRVFGTMRTEDGQPMKLNGPADLQGFILSGSQNFMSSNLFWPSGSFSEKVRGRFISLSIWAKGYAPIFADAKVQGGEAGSLSLVLKRGIPARIRLVTPDGTPLAGVVLNGVLSKTGRFASIKISEMRTDVNGNAVVNNVEANTLLALSAEKPGWQYAEKVLSDWKPDQVSTWQLKPASPNTGTIIDQTTQQPVSNAEILLASINRNSPFLMPGGCNLLTETTTTTFNPNDIPPPPVLARTDDQGRFRLDALSDENTDWIYVRAPGYQMTSLPVKSGEPNVKVELDRGLSVRGRILDPDDILRTAQKPLTIGVQSYIQVDATLSTGYTISEPVTQSGSDMTFSFSGLPRGRRTFRVNYVGPSFDLDLQKDTDDFVIDLSAAAQKKAAASVRTVQILLDSGPGQPPATGQVHVESLSQNSPVINGRVTLSVPTPNDLTIDPDGLIGYWFLRQDFKIPPGDGSFIKTIPLVPAGAIRGKVTADSSVRDQPFSCIAFVVKRSPPLEFGGGGVSSISNGAGSFIAPNTYLTASLPFGGTYAVLLCPNSGANFAVSPPFTIDAEHPIIEYDMHRVAGQTLRGRFLDESNKPIGAAHIALVYWPPTTVGWNQCADVGMTARDGTFAIPEVNLDLPGYCEVQLYDPKWAQNSVHIDRHTPQPLTLIARRR